MLFFLICVQHVQEFLNYAEFVLWWVSLGVASSIGLGKFYLYLSKL
jgi:vacuole membrane protein 1